MNAQPTAKSPTMIFGSTPDLHAVSARRPSTIADASPPPTSQRRVALLMSSDARDERVQATRRQVGFLDETRRAAGRESTAKGARRATGRQDDNRGVRASAVAVTLTVCVEDLIADDEPIVARELDVKKDDIGSEPQDRFECALASGGLAHDLKATPLQDEAGDRAERLVVVDDENAAHGGAPYSHRAKVPHQGEH
jgi:hypothetical protein